METLKLRSDTESLKHQEKSALHENKPTRFPSSKNQSVKEKQVLENTQLCFKQRYQQWD